MVPPPEKRIAQTAQQVWDFGVALDEALARFGDLELLSKLRDHDTAPEVELRVSDSIDGIAALKGLSAYFSERSERSTVRAQLLEPLQDALLDELYNGELLAAGFQVMPGVSDDVVTISPRRFETPKIRWLKCEVEAGGHTYINVKVRSAYDPVPVWPSIDPLPMPSTPRTVGGRPSKRREIEAAVRSLVARDGPGIFDVTAKQAALAVASMIHGDARSADNKGLNVETIRRVLVTLRPELASSKPR